MEPPSLSLRPVPGCLCVFVRVCVAWCGPDPSGFIEYRLVGFRSGLLNRCSQGVCRFCVRLPFNHNLGGFPQEMTKFCLFICLYLPVSHHPADGELPSGCVFLL